MTIDPKALRGLLEKADLPLKFDGDSTIITAKRYVFASMDPFEGRWEDRYFPFAKLPEAINALPDLLDAYEERDSYFPYKREAGGRKQIDPYRAIIFSVSTLQPEEAQNFLSVVLAHDMRSIAVLWRKLTKYNAIHHRL